MSSLLEFQPAKNTNLSQLWSFQSDSEIWRAISPNPYKILTWNSQDYHILFIVRTCSIIWCGLTEWPKSNSLCLLWNLEDPVLTETLSWRRKITYCLFILIDFFHKLNWFQCRCWAYALFTCSSPAAIDLHAPVSYISCQWQLCWAKQTTSIWIWRWCIINKTLPDLLK